VVALDQIPRTTWAATADLERYHAQVHQLPDEPASSVILFDIPLSTFTARLLRTSNTNDALMRR
jgi:hypothetical protein